MANLFSSSRFNFICLYSTLIAFSMTSMPQLNAYQYQQMALGLNDIAFGLKIEKLIKKINKYRECEDIENLLETMIEVKVEVEGYTGKKINIDKELEKIELEIKKKGGKLKKKELSAIRKLIKKKEDRINHKAMYMTNCAIYGIEYNIEQEKFDYLAKHSKDKNDEKKNEAGLPIRVTLGVTLALCGLFLTMVPIPICKTYGPSIMRAGVALAVDGTLNRMEEDEEDNKKKHKN